MSAHFANAYFACWKSAFTHTLFIIQRKKALKYAHWFEEWMCIPTLNLLHIAFSRCLFNYLAGIAMLWFSCWTLKVWWIKYFVSHWSQCFLSLASFSVLLNAVEIIILTNRFLLAIIQSCKLALSSCSQLFSLSILK